MSDLITEYNYDVFKRENFSKWMHWGQSPAIGANAPDFPLWNIDGSETSLSTLWGEQQYLVVEFGSFT